MDRAIYSYSMSIVRRLTNSHGCVVLVIPKPTCRLAGLAAGDYVEVHPTVEPGVAIIRKLILPEPQPHGNQADPDRRS